MILVQLNLSCAHLTDINVIDLQYTLRLCNMQHVHYFDDADTTETLYTTMTRIDMTSFE